MGKVSKPGLPGFPGISPSGGSSSTGAYPPYVVELSPSFIGTTNPNQVTTLSNALDYLAGLTPPVSVDNPAVIYAFPGTYNTATINTPGITIVGSSPEATIINGLEYDPNDTRTNSLTIQNCAFNATLTINTPHLGSETTVTVQNCQVAGINSSGDSSTTLTFDDCNFLDNDLTFSGNVVINNSTGDFATNTANGTTANLTITDSNLSFDTTLAFGSNQKLTIKNSTINFTFADGTSLLSLIDVQLTSLINNIFTTPPAQNPSPNTQDLFSIVNTTVNFTGSKFQIGYTGTFGGNLFNVQTTSPTNVYVYLDDCVVESSAFTPSNVLAMSGSIYGSPKVYARNAIFDSNNITSSFNVGSGCTFVANNATFKAPSLGSGNYLITNSGNCNLLNASFLIPTDNTLTQNIVSAGNADLSLLNLTPTSTTVTYGFTYSTTPTPMITPVGSGSGISPVGTISVSNPLATGFTISDTNTPAFGSYNVVVLLNHSTIN